MSICRMKIIFTTCLFWNDFYNLYYYEHLAVKSTLGRYLYGVRGIYFKFAITVLVRHLWFAYLYAYVGIHICQCCFKVVFWGLYSLMLKPFAVNLKTFYLFIFVCFYDLRDIVQYAYFLNSLHGSEYWSCGRLRRVVIIYTYCFFEIYFEKLF